jgi:uncharacterized membrane protein YdfJ with MMPL/SSD domain
VSDVENRLRDLRQATNGQIRPSADLLGRIESSLEPRTWRRWPMTVAVVAATLVILVIVASQSGPRKQHLASRPPTQAEFVSAMNQSCAEFVAETQEVAVVFPAADAYVLAAENRIQALSRSVERIHSVGSPPQAPGLLEEVRQGAAVAEAHARGALESARAGDTAGAAAGLGQFQVAVNAIGDLLAKHGADGCRPAQAP